MPQLRMRLYVCITLVGLLFGRSGLYPAAGANTRGDVQEVWRLEAPLRSEASAPEMMLRFFSLTPPSSADTGSAVDIQAIDIVWLDAERPEQRLEGFAAQLLDIEAGQGFVLEDMNFDGYNDLRIVEFLPAAPNVPYHVWLYEPQSGLFVADEALSSLVSPQVDAQAEQILSFYRLSPTTYVQDFFGYVDGSLRLLRREEQVFLPNEERFRLRVFLADTDQEPSSVLDDSHLLLAEELLLEESHW